MKALGLAVVGAFLMVNAEAGVVAGWDVAGVDVDDGYGVQTNIAPYALEATTNLSGVSSATLTLGDGGLRSTSTNVYGFKVSVAMQTNSLAGAIALNQYIDCTLILEAGYSLNLESVEIKGGGSSTACSNVAFMTSMDGFVAGKEIALANQANTEGGLDTDASGFGTPIDLSARLYQDITGSVSFRLYGWNSTSGSGTTRIRNLTGLDFIVNGEVVESSGSGDVQLSLSASNSAVYVFADFDGAAATNYVLQSCTNLVSNAWDTVSGTISADTNIAVNASHEAGFFRIIVE